MLNVSGVTEINLASSGSSFLRNVEIAWPSTIDKVVLPGSSTTIPLQVNYDKWLEGIDFAADITTIQALIAENTDKAFEIGL